MAGSAVRMATVSPPAGYAMARVIVCLEMPAMRKTVLQRTNLRPPTLAGVET